MELSLVQQKIIQQQFDSFCKKVLRNKSRDIERQRIRKGEKEVCFSGLASNEKKELFVLDCYPSDYTWFRVLNHWIAVQNEQLAGAIASLPEDKRDILLLSYFLEMNDCEIAEMLNIIRRTVQRRRCSSIEKIKERLEVESDE